MLRHTAFFLLVAALALGIAKSAKATGPISGPFFIGLGDLPGGIYLSQPWDISSDGSVVVGWSINSEGSTSAIFDHFLWTRATGMVGLGIRNRYSPQVSADGSTVVGGLVDASSAEHSFRYTDDSGVTFLPLQVGWLTTSHDGSIVAGEALNRSTGRNQAARWTEAGGVELLPLSDFEFSDVVDISADGSAVVGRAINFTSFTQSVFTWNADDGVTILDLPSLLSTDGTFLDISDNGQVVTSIIGTAGDRRGFRWTIETGVVDVGRLPDGPWMSATGVSADGSVIVGNSQAVTPQRPAIWDVAHGPRYLTDILVNELGLADSLAGWTVGITRGISGDGRTIMGEGINPDGNTEAWIAYLATPVPEPRALALTVLAIAPFTITRRRLAARGHRAVALNRS